jgi:hypothetical protein
VEKQFSQITVFIYYATQIQHLDQLLDLLLADMETPEETRHRKSSRGYHHCHAAYLDACVEGLWDAECYTGVIPCRSLWNKDGRRLAAVLIFNSFLETGDSLVNNSA